MKFRLSVLLAGIAIFLSGCVQTKYNWGGYEQGLYDYYKTPAEIEAYAETLAKVITEGEREGKVPPGIYAEFGYILLIKGDGKKAVGFFEKEKKLWPESARLMDTMIKNANKFKYKKPEDAKSGAKKGSGQ